MNLVNFFKHYNENYYLQLEKGQKWARILAILIFLFALFLFISEAKPLGNSWIRYSCEIGKNYPSVSFIDGLNSIENEIALNCNNISTVFTYLLLITFGLFIRAVSLLFKGRNALRFAIFGGWFAFFAWLGYKIWTANYIGELMKYVDICFPSQLLRLSHETANLITIGFIFYFFYKIIFSVGIAIKTIRK
jgi:hypothetical protein